VTGPNGGAGNGSRPPGSPAGAPPGLAADGELRALIREVLRDVLPALTSGSAISPGAGPAQSAGPADSSSPTSYPSRSGPARSGDAPRQPPAAPPSSVPPANPSAAPAASALLASAGASGRSGPRDGADVRVVRLATDEELRAFVLQVVRLADNPKRRGDLLAGRLRFTLDGGGPAAAPAVQHRVDKGAVTERAVIAAAGAGAALVLGPRAVLTPLARDKARALGVRVDKER
jgi:hypothetical protein